MLSAFAAFQEDPDIQVGRVKRRCRSLKSDQNFGPRFLVYTHDLDFKAKLAIIEAPGVRSAVVCYLL